MMIKNLCNIKMGNFLPICKWHSPYKMCLIYIYILRRVKNIEKVDEWKSIQNLNSFQASSR